MTFEEFKHDLQNDYGRINFRETLMLRRAYDAGRNQNLEEWKVLEKNYDDLYERTRWHFPAKGEMPTQGQELLLYTKPCGLIFGELCEGYNNLWTSDRSDFSTEEVIAWIAKENLVPKGETL